MEERRYERRLTNSFKMVEDRFTVQRLLEITLIRLTSEDNGFQMVEKDVFMVQMLLEITIVRLT